MQEPDSNGALPWERVAPPLWWPAAGRHIVADRHLPDGTRQHMVEGSVEAGVVLANAQVLGATDQPDAEFSATLSHLSAGTSSSPVGP